MLELEPLHEEAHRALMWFLATGGQRSAALAQFETCRYVLREELGVEPSAATLALRDEIALAGEFAGLTELRAGGGAQRPSRTRSCRAPLGDAGRPRAGAGPAARAARRPRLPAGDPGRPGRHRQDPAGGGGRRRPRRGRHRDGGVFVSFVGTGRQAGGGRRPDDRQAGRARSGCRWRSPATRWSCSPTTSPAAQLLLVLDNLEQLRDAAEVLAELLRPGAGRAGAGDLPAAPRPRSGVAGRGARAALPAGGRRRPHRYEAVQLFQERARLLRPGFRAARGPPGGGAASAGLLAGVPLAIELAARWVRSATPAAIADRLAGRPRSAGDHRARRRAAAPQPALGDRLVLAAAHRRRTRVLPGCRCCAAASTWRRPPRWRARACRCWPRWSTSRWSTVGEDGRYGMHELLRQYAAELLAADPADEQATPGAATPSTTRRCCPTPASGRPVAGSTSTPRSRTCAPPPTGWSAHADPARLDAHLLRVWARCTAARAGSARPGRS